MSKKTPLKRLFFPVVFVLGLVLTACGSSTPTSPNNTPTTASSSPATPTVASSSAATATPKASTEKVKLTFWDENAGPTRTPYYQELIKRFQAQYPNIEIEYVGIPASSNKQKYDVAIVANDTPDVAGVTSTWIADFAAKGALLELDGYFNAWKEKDKIASSQIQFSRSMASNQKLYQLPNTTNIDLLWYRTDWFKETGLTKLESWEDFFTGVEKLTDTAKGRYGFSIRGGAGSIAQLTSMMYSYSGIDSFFDKEGKATVNNALHVEFLKKYAAIYRKYTPTSDITNGFKEMVAAFGSGTAGIIQHNLGSYAEHLKTLGEDKFSGVPLPATPKNNRLVLGTNNGYGIFKNTKNPEAAWQFLSFLVSAESQAYWNQNIGQLPTNTEASKNSFFQNAPHLRVASSVIGNSTTTVLIVPSYLPDYSAILSQQEVNFQKLLSGTQSAEEFVNGWASALEKSKADYDKNVKK
jgi:multiple sugar transport system substrate-binding protein